MTTILVTNDDGVHAPGLLALKRALEGLGEILVLAPERNWSATGHNKTMHEPLRVTRTRLLDDSEAHACSGSPADCVALAALGVFDTPIDLVVSGINQGHNMGNDTAYSGTVACAREATINNIPGIAVSTALPNLARVNDAEALDVAGKIAALVAGAALEHGLPRGTLLNVNVPAVAWDSLRGLEITRLGVRTYDDKLLRRHDPYGRIYYWLGGALPTDTPDDGTDVGAVMNDIVSVTPIGLDMTNYTSVDSVRNWNLDARLREGAHGLQAG